MNFASVVQWQNTSFPSSIRGFDSPRSLQYCAAISIICVATALAGCSTVPSAAPVTLPAAQAPAPAPRLVASAYKAPMSVSVERFVWPVKGSVVSSFGSKAGQAKNKGIDICAARGMSVLASRSGKVVFCDNAFRGFGKTIIIDHGDAFQTVYAYNAAILVNLGDIVEQRTEIAKVGSTGRANGPTLHFEIRKNGEPQNPFSYLTR